jgi:hypothetical protein
MSRPVLVLASIVAGASALTGVLAAEPSVPRWLLIVLAGVTTVGTAVGGVVTQTKTAPWKDVAARLTEDGSVVAGPASPVPLGHEVDVTRTEPSGTL